MTTLNLKSAVSAFKNPHNIIYLIAVLVLALFASGAFAQSGSVYGGGSVQNASPVTKGIVLQIRQVTQEASQTAKYGGMAAGAALGGVVAQANNNQGFGVMGVLGSLLGGLGGQAVANAVGTTSALEIIVQTEGSANRQPEVIAITQPNPGQDIREGDRVLLIQTAGAWRVIKSTVTYQ